MNVLTPDQIQSFHRDGYLLLENAIEPETLNNLNTEFNQWKEESRDKTEPYGVTYDNRPRFDLEPGHTSAQPALRRIASPIEISDAYLHFMRNNKALDAVSDLYGPNIKFNNSKINSKQPGTATQIKFHQDFLFEPRTNKDMITVLFFLDGLTPENGPLEVVPGSHKGELYEHWHDGVYTGAVAPEVMEAKKGDAVPCFGPAGSACLMHTTLLHGSGPNLSAKARTLFICEYCAEDSYPLQVNHIPRKYMEEIVRGEFTSRVRCSDYDMAFPEVPKGASFFEQQAKDTSNN